MKKEEEKEEIIKDCLKRLPIKGSKGCGEFALNWVKERKVNPVLSWATRGSKSKEKRGDIGKGQGNAYRLKRNMQILKKKKAPLT